MLIDYETLRTKATTVVMIPDHYRLEMEDNTPKGDEKYRSFIWEDPEKNDCKIEVVLDLETGDLIRLDIDMEDKNTGNQDNSEEDAKAIADAFLMKHNPDHTAFTWVNIEERQNFRFITYREEVGGLPLPDTGCEITLDNSLNIIRYRSEQKTAPRPKWPDSIVDAKNVRQQVLSDLQMKLTMVTLYPSMYEMEGTKPEYRLVYEAIPAHRLIDAITGVDHFGIEHYMMPPSHPITPMERDNTSNLGGTLTLEESEKGKMPLNLDHPSEGLIKNIAAWELLLGIDPKLYMLEKSKDDDERIELLYKLKGKVGEGPEPEALSVDAYT
ncbi:YcdB/YcdC domain-containing protein [Aneurinibacillus migulanus]|uniref:YcdB/YcdC domain-containing protein n=1 Tax=Aneurinibacillus migulanus TaxID=47500 RepID=UPI0006A95C10|nr:YcdB/YcdC domain-containing protein [Aneurinibacillus migulanus]